MSMMVDEFDESPHLPKILLPSPTFFLIMNLPIVPRAMLIAFARALTCSAAFSWDSFSLCIFLHDRCTRPDKLHSGYACLLRQGAEGSRKNAHSCWLCKVLRKQIIPVVSNLHSCERPLWPQVGDVLYQHHLQIQSARTAVRTL